MSLRSQFIAHKTSIFLPAVTASIAALIFVADTVTGPNIIASFLYVAVVLLSVNFLSRHGVILVFYGCVLLIIFSYFLTTNGISPPDFINTAISISALAITTYLALQIKSARTTVSTLAETNLLRDALIGSVSHELRTPLASILGGASILAELPAVTSDARLTSLANGIRDEATQLNNDIQNLLDAARITSHGMHSNRDWTEPADIINSAVERIRLRHPNHRFDLDIDSDLPLLRVDPVLVEQALGQIVANSAKYSPSTSTIKISAKADLGNLTISIIDQGVGLTEDEKGRLTERFFRGSRHAGKIPGSGLGLWIANTFIMNNGGSLQALSPGEGQGTTIKIVFPLSTQNYRAETTLTEE